MPLPAPFVTAPLANLLIVLDALGDDETNRRRMMREEFDACLQNEQSPDALSRAEAIRTIISRWQTLSIVVEELKEKWIAANGLPAHVALAHSFSACTKGMSRWRAEQALMIGKVVTDRVLHGRYTEGWQGRVAEEDRLTAEVDHFDHLLLTTKSSLETFGNHPSLTTFNRALNDVVSLGQTFPWST